MITTTGDIYVSDYRFNRVAEAIAALQPCPFKGEITADQIKRALGEFGDIWPLSIAADVIRTGVADVEIALRRAGS